MKVIFAGTPEFAAVALQAPHEAGFEIPLVLTQPDRPAGRGMHLGIDRRPVVHPGRQLRTLIDTSTTGTMDETQDVSASGIIVALLTQTHHPCLP